MLLSAAASSHRITHARLSSSASLPAHFLGITNGDGWLKKPESKLPRPPPPSPHGSPGRPSSPIPRRWLPRRPGRPQQPAASVPTRPVAVRVPTPLRRPRRRLPPRLSRALQRRQRTPPRNRAGKTADSRLLDQCNIHSPVPVVPAVHAGRGRP